MSDVEALKDLIVKSIKNNGLYHPTTQKLQAELQSFKKSATKL